MSGASSWGWRTPMPSSRIPPVRLAGFASTPCSGRCCRPNSATSTRGSLPACTGCVLRGMPRPAGFRTRSATPSRRRTGASSPACSSTTCWSPGAWAPGRPPPRRRLVTRLLAHGTAPALPGLQSLPPGLRSPEAAVIRTAVALAGGHDPAPSDLATSMSAQKEGDRLPLRVSATLACLMASAATDGGPESLLTRVDAAAALVAELPEEEGRARRDCAAVLSDLRALATLRTDAPAGQLLTALRAAAAAAQSAGSRRLRRRAVSNLALVEALEGHLTRAAELAGEAEV